MGEEEEYDDEEDEGDEEDYDDDFDDEEFEEEQEPNVDKKKPHKKIGSLFSGIEEPAADMFDTGFGESPDANMIRVQIDSEKLLSDIGHYYRGDRKVPKNGKLVWETTKSKKDRLLNDYGYTKLMEINLKYINPNTILSAYTELRIYQILSRLGHELRKFILLNYKKIGLDTKEKESQYTILVITTLHMIESSYRRAIGAKTFEDINQSRLGMSLRENKPTEPIVTPKKSFLQRLAGL